MELKKQFIYPDEAVVQQLMRDASISKLEASIMVNRGITDKDAVHSFLDNNLSSLHNPVKMQDAQKAAEIICKHIKAGNHIVVYSDYDADGWGAAVVGHKMLSEMGATVDIYTNLRDMGYGAKPEGIDEILTMWPDTKLIVTADNGIVAYDAIDYANSKGLEVVVTDHHQPASDGVLPNALANVNPHRADDAYPCDALCGAGVLWKVLTICYVIMGIPSSRAYEVLDIVATATIADVVPLVDENRIIVRHGLKMITDDCRPAWKAFKKVFSDMRPIVEVNPRTVSFSFGPGINAMSRMKGNIRDVIKMFTEPHTDEELLEMATTIKKVNEERKIITKDFTNAAMVKADIFSDNSVLVINHEEFFEGVVGLVAGRVREAVNKPTIVLTKDENGDWRGSGRSIQGFPIKDILDKIQSEHPGLIKAYGGHAQACGLTIENEHLSEFVDAIISEGDKLPEDAFVKKIRVDGVYHDGELTSRVYDTVFNMEPYGASFEEPVIMVVDIPPEAVRTMGSDNQHISFKCKGFQITSWYGAASVDVERLSDIVSVSAVGRLERDDFGLKLFADPTEFVVKYKD